MLRTDRERVRGNFRADVDRIVPMGGGWWANVVAPLGVALLAACVIAFGAAAFVRLLEPAIEALK